MNDSISPSVPAEMPAFKDRSTGLTVFGVLTILLGVMCGLMVLLMLVSQAVMARTNPEAMNTTTILPGLSTYLVMAVALVWLGIGSTRARRWARALLLIFSWLWLLMGILMVTIVPFFMAKGLAGAQANLPPNAPPMTGAVEMGVIAFMTLFFAIFFVALPLVWLLFYRSPQVKATCERRDPVECWTDRCPLPVLALPVVLVLSVPIMLLMACSGHTAMPFFGTFFSGIAGSIYCIIFAGLWACIAWLLYQVKPAGWWLATIAMVLLMVSSWITFTRHSVVEMYQLMDFPPAQIDQIRKSGMTDWAGWLMSLSCLPMIAYLVFIKRYFSKERAGQ